MSARVGSIGDNGLGGWYSYRASKSALNQLTKTMSLECARRKLNVACILLHPGTVDTDLSAPFQKVRYITHAPNECAAALQQQCSTLLLTKLS